MCVCVHSSYVENQKKKKNTEKKAIKIATNKPSIRVWQQTLVFYFVSLSLTATKLKNKKPLNSTK